MTCRWNAKLSDSFSDLFGRYVPARIEGGFVPLYCCYSRHCLVPCGNSSRTNARRKIKILPSQSDLGWFFGSIIYGVGESKCELPPVK